MDKESTHDILREALTKIAIETGIVPDLIRASWVFAHGMVPSISTIEINGMVIQPDGGK